MKSTLWSRTTAYRFSEDDSNSLSPEQKQLEALIRSGEANDSNLHRYSDQYFLENISTIRQNLLEWIAFDKTGNVLELDAKSGLMTELLCARFGHVTAVIPDAGDAYLNFLRNKSHNNLDIRTCHADGVGAPFADGTVSETEGSKNGSDLFDAVTLTGIDAFFIDGLFPELKNENDPDQKLGVLLSFVHSCLDDQGQLILAVNNRLGIQYWSGNVDRCSDKIFDTVCGNISGQKEYSFSKKALTKILSEEKFCDISFYYPIPDYRFPQEIFSDSRLPNPGDVRPVSVNYEKDHYQLFDEKMAIDSLCKDGLFDQFANSYLVLCRKG